MSITVDLNAKGDIASQAIKASDAMAALAEQEKRVQAVAKELGTEDYKQVAKALSQVDSAQKKVASAAQKSAADQERAAAKLSATEEKLALKQEKDSAKTSAQKEKAAAKLAATQEKAAKKSLADEEKAAKKREALDNKEGKRREKLVKDLLHGNVAEAGGLGASGIAAQALTAALAGAAIAAVAVGAAIAGFALKANEARNNALEMFNVLTGGRGEQALEQLEGLAEQLGVKVGDARDQFIKFRQAGADNSVSAALLKLTADLNAVDKSGALAEQAISKTLAHKKADGTVDIKAARDQMALLAKQAGVAGDGARSAEARFTTLGGALNSLDNSKTLALEKIGEKIAPAFDAAAGKVALMVDQFLNSPRGAKAIDTVSNAITAVVDGASEAIDVAASFIDTLDKWSPVLKAIGAGAAFAGAVFLATMVPALWATAAAATAAAVPVIVAAAPFLALAAAGAAVYLALTHLPEIVSFVSEKFASLSAGAASLGTDIVNGIIGGLTGAAGRLWSATGDLAQGALDKFKGVLGIKSPSTKFAEAGDDSVAGYEGGTEKAAPRAIKAVSDFAGDVADAAAPTPEGQGGGFAPATAGTGAALSGGASGAPISITIGDIIIPAGNPNAQEIARSIRREIQLQLSSLTLQQGLPS